MDIQKFLVCLTGICNLEFSFITQKEIKYHGSLEFRNLINNTIEKKQSSLIVVKELGEAELYIPLLINQKFYGCIFVRGRTEKLQDKEFSNNIKQLCNLIGEQIILNKSKPISDTLSYAYTFDDIISQDSLIAELKESAKLVARTDSTILITGESGTGKEILTHAIHSASLRSKRPLVTINCSAIPEQLLESELFGYVKGAFTGASPHGKKGKFEVADGGTIFLDEIAEMPLSMQAKLLRVLQEKKIQKVGSEKDKMVDVRVIAATNRNLAQMVESKQFRMDLYYRLNVIPFNIPPLRERKNDILLLAKHFIAKYNNKFQCNVLGLTKEAEQILDHYSWPGNVRELQNTIEFALNFCREGLITKNFLPKKICCETNLRREIAVMSDLNIAEWEKKLILAALKKYGLTTEGKKQAAEALGINYTTLYRKIKNYNL